MGEIARLKDRLDMLRPLRGEQVSSLMSLWVAQTPNYVQASNAVEGNTLTVGETMVIIDEDRVVPNKSMTEHRQAVNGARAFKMMLEMAAAGKAITIPRLLEIHAAVEAGYDHAGKMRDHAVDIGGSMHVPPNYTEVPRLMDEAFERFDVSMRDEHPVIVAARLHFDLVTIHPFADGNGRTSRLAQNLALIENGYPPVLIRGEDRGRDFDVLQRCQVEEPGSETRRSS